MLTKDQFIQEISDLDLKATELYSQKVLPTVKKRLEEIASVDYDEDPLGVTLNVYLSDSMTVNQVVMERVKEALHEAGYPYVKYKIKDAYEGCFSFPLYIAEVHIYWDEEYLKQVAPWYKKLFEDIKLFLAK